jgi:hypothetical protein
MNNIVSKKLTDSEVKQLFDEDKLLKHIRWAIDELQAGNPFKTITEKKIKYSFYCKYNENISFISE